VEAPIMHAPLPAIFDESSETLLSADCFGALLPGSVDRADDIDPLLLHEGLTSWATVDAPWLAGLHPEALEVSLKRIRLLSPRTVLSAHLPPAQEMTERLLVDLASAQGRTPFIGPDQAGLERMKAEVRQEHTEGIGASTPPPSRTDSSRAPPRRRPAAPPRYR
jgi:hypothetical protein